MSNVQLGDELRIVVPRLLDEDHQVKILWSLLEVERKLAAHFGSFTRVDGIAGTTLGSTAVAIYDVPATENGATNDLIALRHIGLSAVLALGIDSVYTRGPAGQVCIVTRPKAPTISIEV